MYIFLIIAFNLALLGHTIRYGLVSDDIPAMRRDIKPPKNYFKRLWLVIRGYKIFNAKEAHAVTLAIHIVNAVLIYFAFGRTEVAFYGSLLFSASPAGTQCSVWPSGKSYSLSLMFVLLMFAIPQASGIFYGLGVWASCTSFASFIPYLFMHKWYWLLLALPFIPIMWKRKSEEMDSHAYLYKKELIRFYPRKIIVAVKTFGRYAQKAVFPLRLGWDDTFLYQYGFTKSKTKEAYSINADFGVGIAIITAFLATILYMGWTHPISIGLIWFTANIACWCNLISVCGRTADRYQYIASVGIFQAIAGILYVQPEPIFYGGYFALLSFLCIRNYMWSQNYDDAYWNVQMITSEQPGCASGWLRSGCDRLTQRDYRIAFLYLLQARKACNDFLSNYNLCICTLYMGDIVGSKLYFMDAERLAEDRMGEDHTSLLKTVREVIESCEKTAKEKGYYDVPNGVLQVVNIM